MRLFQQDVTARPAPFAGRFRRASPIAVATAILFGMPDTGHALGLGRVVGEPVLGESLQLEVPLTGTIDQPLDNECVAIRRPPDSVDADYFPRDLLARVDRLGSRPRLLLTTRSALHQPLVEFRVSITCGYNLSHDYLLMASPRSDRAPLATAAPSVARAAVAGPVRPAGDAPSIVTPVATGGDSRTLPDGIPGKDITLDQAMSLEQLARQHFPGPLRQERFMRWVAEANPQLFAGVTNLRQHHLSGGQRLLIPDGVPPRRPGDHQNGASPLGEPVGIDAANSANTATRRKTKAATASNEGAPGKTVSDGSKDRLVVGSGSGNARDFKETVALVDRLTGMMQQQLSAQTANDEKIQKLESDLAELGQYVVKLESEQKQRDVAWQAELQATRKAREEETERGWWQLLLAIIAGGLAGVGAMSAYRFFDRSRNGADLALESIVPPVPPAATEAPPPPSAPITEFGWDDEIHRGEMAQKPTTAAKASQPASRAGITAATGSTVAVAASQVRPAFERVPEPVAALLAPIDFEPPGLDEKRPAHGPAPAATNRPVVAEPIATDPSDPATAAIELANIMISMGLAESAAQTLVEHIRSNPRQSLQHWLKLLELHRINGNREEFERSANEMREHFNVQADEWAPGIDVSGRGSLETYPHVRAQLVALWRTPDCPALLETLLADNRGGTRVGFPLPVAEEILLLTAILSSPE
jgi:hypothetical protein